MRNFGSMRAAFAEADAQAIRLGIASGCVANATPARHAGSTGKRVWLVPIAATDSSGGLLVFKHARSGSSLLRSGGYPSGANDNLVYFAGLTLTGYSDTSGAPLAYLRR